MFPLPIEKKWFGMILSGEKKKNAGTIRGTMSAGLISTSACPYKLNSEMGIGKAVLRAIAP